MSAGASIPNIYHFVFGLRPQTEPFHLMFYLCLASCLAVNRPDRIFFYYRHEPFGPLWDRIRPSLELVRIEPEDWIESYEYSDPMIARYRYAHLADFVRLRVLVEHGGIYADMDTLFLRPIPSDWFARKFILGLEKPAGGHQQAGSLCNAWIASAPGADFGVRWLSRMAQSFDGTWSNHSTLLPYRMSVETPDAITVEPATSFYALDWTPTGLRNLLSNRVDLPREAYSLHLWSHLWFDDRRVDFSSFGARLLTPEYVRHANTTYARHARRFLPDDLGGPRWQYWGQRINDVLMHPRSVIRDWTRRG